MTSVRITEVNLIHLRPGPIGDKGKGTGNEPFRADNTDVSDHDPNVAGGNGGDPDTE